MGKTRPRDIGTAAESAVVKVLAQYWPTVDRAPLHGSKDTGDILGTPYVWEVKGGHAAEAASDGQIDKWIAELEAAHGHAVGHAVSRGLPVPPFAFLVTKRKGVGMGNAFDWWVHMTVETLALITSVMPQVLSAATVRMRLGDLCHLLQKREGLDG